MKEKDIVSEETAMRSKLLEWIMNLAWRRQGTSYPKRKSITMSVSGIEFSEEGESRKDM